MTSVNPGNIFLLELVALEFLRELPELQKLPKQKVTPRNKSRRSRSADNLRELPSAGRPTTSGNTMPVSRMLEGSLDMVRSLEKELISVKKKNELLMKKNENLEAEKKDFVRMQRTLTNSLDDRTKELEELQQRLAELNIHVDRPISIDSDSE